MTVRHDDPDDIVVARSRRVFALGGPVHGVVYGLFTGIVAVTAQRARLLGRHGRTLGLASAAAGILSPLYFRWETAGWFIPVGRFSGYAISSVVGRRLARTDSRG